MIVTDLTLLGVMNENISHDLRIIRFGNVYIVKCPKTSKVIQIDNINKDIIKLLELLPNEYSRIKDRTCTKNKSRSSLSLSQEFG